MHQSVVKFIAYSHRRCSTCFGHYCAHHQELLQTAVAASGFCLMSRWMCFQLWSVCLLTNRPWLETHAPRHLDGNWRLQLQFVRAPDDGHNGARNMLSIVCATKQYILRLFGASGWVFYLIIT
jgi:hypothetical protein